MNKKKKYKILNENNVLLIITEILMGSASTISSSTLAFLNPSAGIFISSSTALLTSFAILITNEYISKLKARYTELRNWIIVISLLYEKILKTEIEYKKIDEKEAQELKKCNNHYLVKRIEVMKSTSLKVEDVFGEIIIKESISPEQITKPNIFLTETIQIILFV